MKHSRITVRYASAKLHRLWLYHEEWHPTTHEEWVQGRRYPQRRPYGAVKVQCFT